MTLNTRTRLLAGLGATFAITASLTMFGSAATPKFFNDDPVWVERDTEDASSMDQKSSGRSLAPSRIFQTQSIFDLRGNLLSSGPLASTTGKMISTDIKPTYTDEMLFGYASPLAGAYSLDVFVMKDYHDIVDGGRREIYQLEK